MKFIFLSLSLIKHGLYYLWFYPLCNSTVNVLYIIYIQIFSYHFPFSHTIFLYLFVNYFFHPQVFPLHVCLYFLTMIIPTTTLQFFVISVPLFVEFYKAPSHKVQLIVVFSCPKTSSLTWLLIYMQKSIIWIQMTSHKSKMLDSQWFNSWKKCLKCCINTHKLII